MINILTNGETFLTIECLYCDSFSCGSCPQLETAIEPNGERNYIYISDRQMLNAQHLTSEKSFRLHEKFNEEMHTLHITDFYATEKV